MSVSLAIPPEGGPLFFSMVLASCRAMVGFGCQPTDAVPPELARAKRSISLAPRASFFFGGGTRSDGDPLVLCCLRVWTRRGILGTSQKKRGWGLPRLVFRLFCQSA